MDLKRYDLALPEWERVKTKGERMTSPELMLGMESLLQTNRQEEAIALLRSALQKHQDQNQKLFLGQLLIRSPLDEVNKEVFLILQGLSQNSDAVGLRAVPFLFVRLDALAALKKWETILKTLEIQPLPIEPYLAELFRARSWGELKKNVNPKHPGKRPFIWSNINPTP